MNQKIIAVAVAAAFAVPAIAAADTTLFGQFKYEVGVIDDGDNRNFVHSTIGTRLGVRGSEDLGGGTSAIFQFTGNFNGVNESLATKSFNLNEENWAGVRGGFGTLQLGRSDTAFKKAHTRFRVFPDDLAELSVRPASWGRAEGVHYSTPNFGGVTVNFTMEPNGVKTKSYYALGVNYSNGPIFISAAVEDAASEGLYQGGGKAIVPGNTNWQAGASYNFGAGTIGALYQDIEDVAKWITVPVTYRVTPQVSLRGAFQHRDPADGSSNSTNWAVGGSYNFSSRTELFVNLWESDKRPSTPGNAAADKVQMGVGLRHAF
jgi:predicted porin